VAGIERKSFDSPDESRSPEKTRVDIVRLGGTTVGRMEAQPGWRWSENIKPLVGGDSCQVRHVGYVVSGSLQVEHNDGTKEELMPGNAYVVEPGHDAWVTSDEPFVGLEFEHKSAEEYAKGS
jgi:hypothetical protein